MILENQLRSLDLCGLCVARYTLLDHGESVVKRYMSLAYFISLLMFAYQEK